MTDLNASTTYEKTQINLQHKFTYSVVEHKFADYIKHEKKCHNKNILIVIIKPLTMFKLCLNVTIRLNPFTNKKARNI